MYKNIIFIILISVVLIAFVACGNRPFVYNRSVSQLKSSIITINQCAILEFDGNRTGSEWHSVTGSKKVRIPAGEHTLVLFNRVDIPSGKRIVNTEGQVTMHYNFLPGRNYIVMASVNDGRFNGLIINEASIKIQKALTEPIFENLESAKTMSKGRGH
ncbi:MAG: hypothetical protein FWH41_04355 [Treponema sp.]|nr:hypothetical protein [Treponema sp.]